MASGSRKGPKKAAAAAGLTPVAGDADLTSCPNCYLYFDYSVRGNNNLVPRLLTCGHLVCSTCVGDLFCEGSLCCPTCCEIHNCESPSTFPAVPASPIPSPQGMRHPPDGDDSLIPSPVSLIERPAISPSPTASPSPASTGNPQALFGTSEDGAGAPGDNRLANFLSTVPGADDGGGGGGGGGGEDGMGSDMDEEAGGLCCLVTDCGRERISSDYFCSRHMDKAKRVSWKAAKRMVQTMSQGLYSMGTVVQGEKLGQFLENDFPSMDNLKPEILSERFQKQETVTLGEALFLIDKALNVLKKEPNALELSAPVKIVGDLHGQFFDLISMLLHCGAPGDGSSYLFLGDYVDRGEFSCEVLLYLLALKVAHPHSVHLIRGNHECRSLTTHFGFKDECKAKYGLPVYYRFLRCFELMPLCAVVSNDHGRYFCTHGGISPGLTSLDQIAALDRRAEPEMEGLLCDLLWADPSDDPGVTNIESLSDQELDGLLNSTFQFNRLRGCSVAFGYLAVRRFLDNNDLLCVVRAHAVQEDGYYRHFEKALKKRSVAGLENKLPPVITVFSAPNYCDRYGNRAAVLELLCDELEPRVKHFECVDHPDRLNRPDRSEVHLTALIESCPYMPTTFRDFVKLAGRMGPAQPLEDGGEASETSSVVGTGPICSVCRDFGCSEHDLSLSAKGSTRGSAPSSPPQGRKDRSLTAHDLYEFEAAHDRINELHPDYLNARIESCEDEGVSRLSTKGNTPSSVSSLVHSTTKITVSELRNRFDPAARERAAGGKVAPRPADMGKPSNTVTQITSIFEHKARSDRRKGHDRTASGSAGIVQQLTASIESKAKLSAYSPGGSGLQTSTKQKISVFESLTKRSRGDNVTSKLGRIKDSALARRVWVDKVGIGSPAPLWRGGNGGTGSFGRDDKDMSSTKASSNGLGSSDGSTWGGGGRLNNGAGNVSPRRHSVAGDNKDGRFPPPPPPGAAAAQSSINSRAPWRTSSAPSSASSSGSNLTDGTGTDKKALNSASTNGRRSTLGCETHREINGIIAQRNQRLVAETAVGSAAPRAPRSRDGSNTTSSPAVGAGLESAPGLGSPSSALRLQREENDDRPELPSPASLKRRGTQAEECAFTHAEILGLKLLFALMDQRGSEFIDGLALEEYADEQDDYAQEREIEACIKAVDVDCDGKIGLMDFICFAARLKCYYEGGVGLQKTLNHAGSRTKSSSLSRPGDSDSDDDDDDDDDDGDGDGTMGNEDDDHDHDDDAGDGVDTEDPADGDSSVGEDKNVSGRPDEDLECALDRNGTIDNNLGSTDRRKGTDAASDRPRVQVGSDPDVFTNDPAAAKPADVKTTLGSNDSVMTSDAEEGVGRASGKYAATTGNSNDPMKNADVNVLKAAHVVANELAPSQQAGVKPAVISSVTSISNGDDGIHRLGEGGDSAIVTGNKNNSRAMEKATNTPPRTMSESNTATTSTTGEFRAFPTLARSSTSDTLDEIVETQSAESHQTQAESHSNEADPKGHETPAVDGTWSAGKGASTETSELSAPFTSKFNAQQDGDPTNMSSTGTNAVELVSVASVSAAISAAVKAATSPGAWIGDGYSSTPKMSAFVEGNPFPTE